MRFIHEFLVVILSVLLLCGCTTEDKENRCDYQNMLEESINQQKQLCMNLDGIWYFKSYYLPNDGAPSVDLAEDYINNWVEITYENDDVLLEFNNDVYSMVYARPLEKFYLRNGYAYSGGVEQKVLNEYACEILFEYEEHSILVYSNKQEDLFLRIMDNIAENACFVLERKSGSQNNDIELVYFEDIVETLLEECKLQERYNKLEKLIPMIEEHDDIFVGENITLYNESDRVYVEINGEKLKLTNITETMGLCTNFMFVSETLCQDDEKALLYTFSNERYDIQIMERTDGEHYIRIYFVEQDAYNIYKCIVEE